MGMFDYVKHECTCPVCKGKVAGFQTKVCDSVLDTLNPKEVSNFYSSCKKCGCWIEFTANEKPNFEKFEMVVTGKNNKILHTKDVRI